MGVLDGLTAETRAPPGGGAIRAHRERIAAEVCAGLRVLDLDAHDEGAGDPAQLAASLSREGREPFEAVVAFDLFERLSDPRPVLEALTSEAGRGLKLVLSLPNRPGAAAVLARFADVHVLHQHTVEASIVHGAAATRSELAPVGPLEQEDAGHLIAFVNFGADERLAAVRGAVRVSVFGSRGRYVRALEAARDELAETNLRLGRSKLGVFDSAAATLLANADPEFERLLRELERTRAELVAVRRHYDKPRYRLVEAARARTRRIPGVDLLLRGLGRLLSR